MEEMIRRDGEDIFITLRIKPNANKTGFTQDYGGEMILNIKSPPTKGKANKEIERFLKSLFKTHVIIVKGKKTDTKVIKIENCTLNNQQIRKIMLD